AVRHRLRTLARADHRRLPEGPARPVRAKRHQPTRPRQRQRAAPALRDGRPGAGGEVYRPRRRHRRFAPHLPGGRAGAAGRAVVARWRPPLQRRAHAPGPVLAEGHPPAVSCTELLWTTCHWRLAPPVLFARPDTGGQAASGTTESMLDRPSATA